MTEYIIIVAFIAILSIAVVTLFGDNIRALFGVSANALRGEETSLEDMGGGQADTDFVERDEEGFGQAP